MFGPKIVEPKNFLNQKFLDPTFLGPKIFFCPGRKICLDPKFFWTKNLSNSRFRDFYQTLSNFINLLLTYLFTEFGTTQFKLVMRYSLFAYQTFVKAFFCFGNEASRNMHVGRLVGFNTNFKKVLRMIYAP